MSALRRKPTSPRLPSASRPSRGALPRLSIGNVAVGPDDFLCRLAAGPPKEYALCTSMVRFEARERHFTRGLPLLGVCALGFAVACSGASGLGPELTADNQATPIAHVDIEHSTNVGFASSRAIAHFVYSRDERGTRGTAALSAVLTGARSSIPDPGRCLDLTSRWSVSSGPVELLEAGTVTIHTTPVVAPSGNEDEAHETAELEGGSHELALNERAEVAAHPDNGGDVNDDVQSAALNAGSDASRRVQDPVTISLAPRAFPGVSSVASGVMYTSRDRETPLPAQADYRVDIEGSFQVPSMTLRGTAPAYLSHVTVGGTPLEQLNALSVGSPIDITWDIGDAEDLVVVDVAAPLDGRAVLRCSYSDAAGAGTVPWVTPLSSLAQDYNQAVLHIHRLRVVETSVEAPIAARGELRFDFELTRNVDFR